ncbi:hypothetical protein [Falsirhodobacter sp. 20TX0035]|uniref:hypothetical protein n=1 Tax=Falsirhodobacter sp. 20TX0035 TaxID=3022019 RepID=UPI00233109D1|nr:hypothetical protein [Falsirhodobacter sp. 20TX0035]MDB6454402.1 hypothetical protein [Falsirhodobacter sp. 20TX0035]
MTDLPDRPLSRILRPAEAEAWQNGFVFLERARAKAESIRATAEAEVAAARAQGHAEGRAAGEAEAAGLLLTTHAGVDRYLAGIEPGVADLVTSILRTLLDGLEDAEAVAAATRRAVASFRAEGEITLSVPLPLVAEVEARIDLPTLRVVGDRLLTGRQCILTSPLSSIDISLDAQLAVLRAAMGAAPDA